MVNACFLELAEPDIVDAVTACAHQGIDEITVVPYFLSAGRHVAEDIPRELAAASRLNQGVRISVTPHIGAIDTMPGFLLDAAMKGDTLSSIE